MTEYVPLLIHLANERGMSDEVKRMAVTLELAGRENGYYGVEYVAGEFESRDESASKKAEEFLEDVADGVETYRDDYERFYDEYEADVEAKLDQYDE